MADERGALANSSTQKLFTDLGLLVRLNGNPVLDNQRPTFDGRQLPQVRVLMAGGDLDEENERFGALVELALKNARRFLDVTLGG